MTTTCYIKNGADVGGIYFNKPDASLGQTVVSQIKLPAIKAGESIIVNGATTVSCLANAAVLYPGFNENTFTASAVYLCRNQQGWWYTPGDCIYDLTLQHGEDIHNAVKYTPMQPYLNHDQTGMRKFDGNDTGDWWVAFVVWCSSSAATGDSVAKNEYLWCIPQQTRLQIMRFSD